MEQIRRDLQSGNFKQFYLLYGPERYLVNQYRENLRKALLDGDESMNLHRYHGKGIPLSEIIDLGETMPFFASRRVFILEETKLFKEGGDALASYLASASESSFFVFAETDVDKRSKMFKLVSEKGYATEFFAPDEATLKKWILGILAREGIQIDNRTLFSFLSRTGDQMQVIRNELDKLIGYVGQGGKITEKTIDDICLPKVEDNVFLMTNALSAGDSKKALEIYYDLILSGEDITNLLGLIRWQFNTLLLIKSADRGGSDDRIAAATGLKIGLVKRNRRLAASFPVSSLHNIIRECGETNYAIRTGTMDEKIAMEMLLIKCAKI